MSCGAERMLACATRKPGARPRTPERWYWTREGIDRGVREGYHGDAEVEGVDMGAIAWALSAFRCLA